MKGRLPNGIAKLSAADARLPLLADGKPPSEFRIFRQGANESDYGPVVFDEIAAKLVLDAQDSKGNPLFFDCNHGMLRDDADVDDAKSYGTFEMAVRDGELWAVNCMWNKDGYQLVADRSYNLFSPAFVPVTDADGVQRPGKLINCALVNLAGLDHIKPLAAAARHLEDTDMTEAEMKALQAKNSELEGKVVSLGARVRGVALVLALSADAGETEVIEAVRGLGKFRGEVVGLTGKATDVEALGAVRAWKDSHGKVAEISARAEEEAVKKLSADFESIMKLAVDDLKVKPADAPAFRERELARMGGKVTADGLALLKADVETRHPYQVKAGGDGAAKPKKGDAIGGDPVVLSAAHEELLAKFGIAKEHGVKAVENINLYRARKRAELLGTEDGAA